MLLSSLLKIRIQTLFNQVSKHLSFPVALVDKKENVLVGNEAYESCLKSGNNIDRNKVKIDHEEFYVVTKTDKNDKRNIRSKDILANIRDSVSLLFEGELEVQSLSQEIIEKYEELNLVYDIIAELAGVFEEKEICRLILQKAIDVLGVDSGAIVLKTENNTFAIAYQKDNCDTRHCHDNLFIRLAQKSLEENSEILYDKFDRIPADILSITRNDELWSMLAVPFSAGNEAFGSIVLAGKTNGKVFNSSNLKLVTALSGYAGVAIHSSRLIRTMQATEALKHEMSLAREIQQSLLPSHSPDIKGVDITGHCIPATEVGGDFFGYFRLADNRWAIVIADVSGHGVGAALTMASLRSILRSEAKGKVSPAHIVSRANELMCADTGNTEMYATLVFSIYDEKNATLLYTNSGHVIPFLRKAKTGEWTELKDGGMPVGLFQEEIYDETSTKLESGDVVVFYTDGLTEAKNEQQHFFSEQIMLEIVAQNRHASSAEIAKAILDAAQKHLGANFQKDDITLVILKKTEVVENGAN
ncbi:MAG: SpoIIE family protein phosphatase [Calditrichaeota bacterium]|nr:SpoIIE family protein phosphatase [Calditrichota bacterium]